MTPEKDKAVALAEEALTHAFQGSRDVAEESMRKAFEVHHQQVIEELANKPGVMPKLHCASEWGGRETGPYLCAADEVREGFATMQENVEEIERDRNEWKDATVSANQRFEIAERKLEQERARVAELEKDAARYRWLRDVSVPPHKFYVSVPVEFDGVRFEPNEVDAYIDAAMKGQQP